MIYIPGIRNKASNTRSRHPTEDTHQLKMHLQDDISAITQSEQPLPDIELVIYMDAITFLHYLHAINWNKVCIATTSDTNITLLTSTIEDGIPEHQQDILDALRIYHPFQEHLSTIKGIILYKDCIIILPSLRQDCLTALHTAHHGTSAMIARAESSAFWISFQHASAATTATAWPLPNLYPHPYPSPIPPSIPPTHTPHPYPPPIPPTHTPHPYPPPIPPTLASYPFSCICADYFHYGGYNYLSLLIATLIGPLLKEYKRGGGGGAKALLSA